MSGSQPHQRHCSACTEYIDYKAYQCPFCGAVQRLPKQQELSHEQKDELHKKKLESMHLPPWLKAVVKAVNFCEEDPGLHKVVRFTGGLVGFCIAYSAAYWINYYSGNYFPMTATWVNLPLALPCMVVFALGYYFFFDCFYIVLEAVAAIVEVEKEEHVRRGVQQARARGKQHKAQASHAKAQRGPEKGLPEGIRPFDADKDEKKIQLEAIAKALEQEL